MWAPKSKPIRVGVANHDRHFMVSHAGTQALLPHPLPEQPLPLLHSRHPIFFIISSNLGSRRKAPSLPRHPEQFRRAYLNRLIQPLVRTIKVAKFRILASDFHCVTVPMVSVPFSQIRLHRLLQHPFPSAPIVGLAVFLEFLYARALGYHRLNVFLERLVLHFPFSVSNTPTGCANWVTDSGDTITFEQATATTVPLSQTLRPLRSYSKGRLITAYANGEIRTSLVRPPRPRT
jgi:hypothetical protein